MASFLAIVALFLSLFANVSRGGITSGFVRKPEASEDMPLDSDVFRVPPDYNAPQQVHIIQGDHEGKAVIVSWTTPKPGSCFVTYWSESNPNLTLEERGTFHTYRHYNYTSGFIHQCTLSDLEYDTKYYYQVGTGRLARVGTRTFWFKTPPPVGPDVPYVFGLIGDLGQTYDSNATLTHYESNPTQGEAVLYVGDLSYADCNDTRWDTWGRFVERNNAYQPWIWTVGNHEVDVAPKIGVEKLFKPYKNRYPTPYKASNSTSPLWYSIKRASAYIIVLSSYSACGNYTPQNYWLEQELKKVDRKETPWLIVMAHAPMYNSYVNHYMEGETMRVVFEPWFVKYKVDFVFAGHVHAYERSHRIANVDYKIVKGGCRPKRNSDAPVYITIGDGGNREGLATDMTWPQPEYSAFRESSFGHAILDIKNRTHAFYSWHRNNNGSAVSADSMWFYNRYWYPVDECESTNLNGFTTSFPSK